MSIVFDNEMMKALEADGEKLRALTGEEHRPYFIADGEPVPADILKAAEEAFQKALGFVGWDDGVACISEAIIAERSQERIRMGMHMLTEVEKAVSAERGRVAEIHKEIIDRASALKGEPAYYDFVRYVAHRLGEA